jgi:hypothetical protein
MGMREEIQAELAESFDDPDGLADAVKPVAGVRKETPAYDPATGQNSGGISTYSGRGVFGSYLAKDVDGSLILTTDVRLLVLQNELLATVADVTAPIEPKVGDTIGGQRVVNVIQDAAGATWTLQLRK